MEIKRIKKNDLFSSLPEEWPVDLRHQIQEKVTASRRKIVVLDDDPTGTQTVHSIPVLTDWSVETLKSQLSNDLPVFYILTNSRSFTLDVAQSINTEIGRNLIEAAEQANCQFVVVSRSDSTLRGHFPDEVDSLATALKTDFDGWIITPFFPEGGRYTIGGIHYVDEEGWLVPAAETEFAKDSVFGYQSSNLCQWIEEKTRRRISSDDVSAVLIKDLREGGPERVSSILIQLQHGSICVVDAVSYRDLEVFILGLLNAEGQGKKFLYRTAASFVQVRSGLTSRPLLTVSDLNLPDTGGGLIIVGSYVPRTSEQLNMLLSQPNIIQTEVLVDALMDDKLRMDEIERVALISDQALNSGKDMVIYTSRQLVTGKDTESSLSIGQGISKGLVNILHKISATPRYILSKGGITSSDVATDALQVKKAMVCGQILPGVPVWKLGNESRYPDLIYIVFPGNVGNSESLVDVINKLKLHQ
ncbi:MAG: four-carbon acid sugar kinase family protein [Desulfobacterales bacterium]